MVVYNITFVIDPLKEKEFLDWMRSSALPRLFQETGKARNPRLQTVIEAGGRKPEPEHGMSIALQAEFDSEEDAHEWDDKVLPGVAGEFMENFNPHALYFATLLEIIPL